MEVKMLDTSIGSVIAGIISSIFLGGFVMCLRKAFFSCIILCAFLVVGAWPLGIQASTGNYKINNMYIFGDSLSDNGNLYAMTYHTVAGAIPNPKRYYHGRFSNGLVWDEYLAPMLGLTDDHVENMAFGGAQIGAYNVNDRDGQAYPGLDQEISRFIMYHRMAKLDAQHNLYVLWIGADNFLGPLKHPRKMMKRAARQLASGIARLHRQLGMQHLMLITMPDLGDTPRARLAASQTGGRALRNDLNMLTTRVNKLLVSTAQRFAEKNNIDLHVLAVNTLLLKLIKYPHRYGLYNIKQSCLASNGRSYCHHPVRYLFWDGIHPTTHVHAILATWIFNTMFQPKQNYYILRS